MPFFTGASDVIISGGTFNSIAGNSVYYATTGNTQNPLRNPDDHNTVIDNHRRPTVPDLEAARDDDDEESLKVPQRQRNQISSRKEPMTPFLLKISPATGSHLARRLNNQAPRRNWRVMTLRSGHVIFIRRVGIISFDSIITSWIQRT